MFQWNKDKARQSEIKHGVSFADTFAVFEDPNAFLMKSSRARNAT
jgi:uncharacterized DUF497 family protein